MSFSYKTLNSNDITLTSYIANKSWEVKNSTLSENGITIFIGENLPITRTSPYDPIDDTETSNDESRRLIFESIKHLYYENYTSGSSTGKFFNSSPYINYEQNTLALGYGISTFRNIPTLTGSNHTINGDSYDNNILYDISSSLYDESVFDPNIGGKITIVSIDQNIMGSGLSPNTIFISGSGYYLRDDGEGNVFNYRNEDNYVRYNSAIYNKDVYLELLNSNQPQLEYVGNVFYSQGLIVITNEDYLCVFGAPPTAVNDYFKSSNMTTPQIYDPLANDISDCSSINFNSFTPIISNGYTFPDYTYSNGFIHITPNHSSVIPGRYQIGYSITNNSGILSNTGSINLEITSEPLIINNIISSSSCYGNVNPLPVTFSINYGVPFYSYSLDNGSTYTGVDSLFNVIVSGSIIPSSSNFIYVKDYLEEISITPLTLWTPEISYVSWMSKSNCYGLSNGKISVTGSNNLLTSIDNLTYYSIPYTFNNLSSSLYTIYVKNQTNCIVSSSIQVIDAPAISIIPTLSHVDCYGNNTGQISLSVTNLSNDYNVIWRDSLNNVIATSSLFISGLSTGSYTASIIDNVIDGCQTISASYIITGSSLITLSSTASYIDSCSSAIIINAQGGNSPYTYYATNNIDLSLYASTSSIIPLTGLGLNSGSFSTYVIDNIGCTSQTSSIDIYSRGYIYSGSNCETI